MLTQLRKSIYFSFSSNDDTFPISEIETVGTLYQKDRDRYHLVLVEPLVTEWNDITQLQHTSSVTSVPTPRLLWLEFSPYRVTLTMQGNGHLSYRHIFEPGVFGVSRFWLQDESFPPGGQLRLRNFTRLLHLKGNPLPRLLLLEYELWSEQLKLGEFCLNLEIQD